MININYSYDYSNKEHLIMIFHRFLMRFPCRRSCFTFRLSLPPRSKAANSTTNPKCAFLPRNRPSPDPHITTNQPGSSSPSESLPKHDITQQTLNMSADWAAPLHPAIFDLLARSALSNSSSHTTPRICSIQRSQHYLQPRTQPH